MVDDSKPNEALAAEVEALRRRVAELEERDRERDRIEAELRASRDLLQTLIDHLPMGLFWKGPDFRYRGANRLTFMAAGFKSHEEIVGRDDTGMPWAMDAAHLREEDRQVVETGATIQQEMLLQRADGAHAWMRRTKVPIRDPSGEVVAILGIAEDITGQKQREQEEEQARAQEEIIRMQSQLLAELSTPLIPVGQGVLALPLIGTLDASRVALMMETLLHGIRRTRARVAILDITGVRGMDEQVASAIARLSRATRLLGAEVVLTGVRPDVARALVEMEVDLGGIVTEPSLESGIAYAARRR